MKEHMNEERFQMTEILWYHQTLCGRQETDTTGLFREMFGVDSHFMVCESNLERDTHWWVISQSKI